ncbi:UDP-2-acetamido-3-amino-2,3-dideoxy-D-glucuronic acid acetyltransferase [hydrothermal vent metagenome]|uniref:UDP-2-acetamido-3-amino-2,3-dideoxy-D-glucuronic acid acetyltransferase n=1 Tax=hydrothermal vent metagenome TaxID=652676 RepID=A0A3B1D653_9ZZZZ
MKFFKHEKSLVEAEAKIGKGTRVWAFTQIQNGAIVGEGCNVCNGGFIEKGAVIGNHVTIKHNVSIFDGVTIEDEVFIGSNIAFINDRNPRSHCKEEWFLEKTVIKKGATLGANVVVLCGVTVGAYAMVGAGCVVTKDVLAHHIVCGNPGIFSGYACFCGQKINKNLECSCGEKFLVKNKQLKRMKECV